MTVIERLCTYAIANVHTAYIQLDTVGLQGITTIAR